jgi:hypothetical protein
VRPRLRHVAGLHEVGRGGERAREARLLGVGLANLQQVESRLRLGAERGRQSFLGEQCDNGGARGRELAGAELRARGEECELAAVRR